MLFKAGTPASSTEHMRIDGATGNVGIRTASPSYSLHVADGDIYTGYPGASSTEGYRLALGNYDGYIWRNQTGSYSNGFVMSTNYQLSDAGSDVISNSGAFTTAIVQGIAGVIDFRTGPINTAPTARMTIANNGDVGIGTASPGQRLEIAGPGIPGSAGARAANIQALNAGDNLIFGSSNGLNIGTIGSLNGNGAPYLQFLAYHSNTSNTGRASGGAGAIPGRIISDFGGNDNALEFQTGNQPGQDNDITWTTALNVHSNGNVGVGLTVAPPEKLSILGNVAPFTDNSYTNGTASLRWTTVYAVNGTINTSDRRLKKNIQTLPYGLIRV